MTTLSIATERAEAPVPALVPAIPGRARWLKAEVIGLDVLSLVSGIVLASLVYLLIWGDLTWSNMSTYLLVGLLSAPAWVFGFVKNRLYSVRFITRGVDESRRVIRGVLIGSIGLVVASVAIQVEVDRAMAGAELRHVSGARRHRAGLDAPGLRPPSRERPDAASCGDHRRQRGGTRAVHRARPATPSRIRPGGHGRQPPEGQARRQRRRRGRVRSSRSATSTPAQPSSRIISATSVLIAASSVDLSRLERPDPGALRRGCPRRAVVDAARRRPRTAHRASARRLPDRLPRAGAPGRVAGRRQARLRRRRSRPAPCAGDRSRSSLVAAVAVKLTSPGPVFFRQVRVGRDGGPFTIYKLRTMVVDAEDQLDRPAASERGRRAALQDARRPAGHPGRSLPAEDLDRRAPAALERPARRDVDGRSSSGARRRGRDLADARSTVGSGSSRASPACGR